MTNKYCGPCGKTTRHSENSIDETCTCQLCGAIKYPKIQPTNKAPDRPAFIENKRDFGVRPKPPEAPLEFEG